MNQLFTNTLIFLFAAMFFFLVGYRIGQETSSTPNLWTKVQGHTFECTEYSGNTFTGSLNDCTQWTAK